MEPVQREERASKMFENKSGTAFQATIPTQRYACASDAFRVRRKDTSKPLPVCLVFPGMKGIELRALCRPKVTTD